MKYSFPRHIYIYVNHTDRRASVQSVRLKRNCTLAAARSKSLGKKVGHFRPGDSCLIASSCLDTSRPAPACSCAHTTPVLTLVPLTDAVSRGTSHVTANRAVQCKYTTSADVRKLTRYKKLVTRLGCSVIVQELCESRGGRPGLSVLTSLLVSVDVKIY